jgi:CheY-like chemotaxis protein
MRVWLADDSDVTRTAIRTILHEEARIRMEGEAATFAQAVQRIADGKPDVLVLDLHMPEKRDFAPDAVRAQLGGVERGDFLFKRGRIEGPGGKLRGGDIARQNESLRHDHSSDSTRPSAGSRKTPYGIGINYEYTTGPNDRNTK